MILKWIFVFHGILLTHNFLISQNPTQTHLIYFFKGVADFTNVVLWYFTQFSARLLAMKTIKNHLLKSSVIFFLSFTTLSGGQALKEEKYMTSQVACRDVCDLDAIYNSTYSYSLPKGVLQGFLSGKAFHYPTEYTSSEAKSLNKDINDLFQAMMDSPVRDNLAVISAGSPGVGKTTLLRQKLEAAAKEGSNYPYVCPDDVCLKGQTRTYGADIEASNGSFKAREEAYTKWRPASNAATHLLLANLIKDKFAFYFGTTCSSPMTFKFFEFLKEQGYRIKVVHVSASDEVRWGSIQERDKSFVQTNEEDICEKGKMVPQRINDTFLKFADEIEFYYRPTVTSDAIHAATWIKDEVVPNGKLTVLNKEAYEGVKAVHNTAIESLNKPELKWEKTVEAASTI
ncbi:MAG: zeta toxin family protein [Chlamydiota bacterium]